MAKNKKSALLLALEALERENEEIDKQFDDAPLVGRTLVELGISENLEGFQYLITAITMCVREAALINTVSTTFYSEIAKQFEVAPQDIEFHIRHAIENAFSEAPTEKMQSYFEYTIQSGQIPSNSGFIAMIADVIRLDARQKARKNANQ